MTRPLRQFFMPSGGLHATSPLATGALCALAHRTHRIAWTGAVYCLFRGLQISFMAMLEGEAISAAKNVAAYMQGGSEGTTELPSPYVAGGSKVGSASTLFSRRIDLVCCNPFSAAQCTSSSACRCQSRMRPISLCPLESGAW